MKKFVVILSIIICLLFCSCTADTSGYKYELTSKSWSAVLEGGARAELSFEGDIALLTLQSGGSTAQIKGKYVADDTSFVIFVPEIAQNYTFNYTPKGRTLELKYKNDTIILKQR